MANKFFHKKLSGVSIHTWLLLGAICIVGYWPISSNLFSLKNDALVYFLPCRYFISESLQSGHLPLWSPYFYMGFPMHGDMQSGAWNPVVLFISLFGKYNMTTLQFETLLYIFIAGLGMYKLLSIVAANHYSKLVITVAYMFCGFVIDTGQIVVWTASTAFIPFVLLYYYRLLYEPDHIYKNALKTAITFYFLLTAGYPSFFIMCGYILFASLLVFCISQARKNNFTQSLFFRLVKANALLLIAFGLIALPALLSYIDYFPYYQRSAGTTLQQAQENPFNPFAIISYLFPLSVTRDHPSLTTDPTARSGYIGLFTLLLLTGIYKKKLNGLQKFTLVFTIFIFLFSLGDVLPVRKFCYHYLPLMNLFRHPATMRLFTTIGLLILSASFIDDFFIALKERSIKYYVWLSALAILVISILSVVYAAGSGLPAKVLSFARSFSTGNARAFLKDYYDGFSFGDAVLLEGFIQVLFLLCFILLIRKHGLRKMNGIVALFIINPILLAQFSIPSTVVTRQSPATINHFIASTPGNYPLPDLNTTIAANNAIEKESARAFGLASFYTKKIVHARVEINPSYTKSLRTFDSTIAIASIVTQYPVCYFADTMVHYKDSMNVSAGNYKILFVDDTTTNKYSGVENDSIRVTQFAPWGLFFETNTQQAKPFVLFQNFNSNWQLLADGQPAPIQKGNISFMYANIPKGKHELQFYYRPAYIRYSIPVSLFAVLAILLFFVMNEKRKRAT